MRENAFTAISSVFTININKLMRIHLCSSTDQSLNWAKKNTVYYNNFVSKFEFQTKLSTKPPSFFGGNYLFISLAVALILHGLIPTNLTENNH